MTLPAAPIAPETLDQHLEFGAPIRVNEDGTISETPYSFHGPDLYTYTGDDGALQAGSLNTDWQLIHGKSNQHGYSGPIMHPSEHISTGWAREILSTPGYYVISEVPSDDPDDDLDDPIGWALAYAPLDTFTR